MRSSAGDRSASSSSRASSWPGKLYQEVPRGDDLEQRGPGGEAAGTGVPLHHGLLRLTDCPCYVVSAAGWVGG